MNKYLAIVPALVVTAGVLYADHRRGEANLAHIRAEVASLSSAVERHQEREPRLVERVTVLAPTANTAAESPAPGKESEATARKDEKPRELPVADVRDRLEAAFVAERSSSDWTREAQSTAQRKLAAMPSLSSSVRSVECRSSMCRIETVHQDAKSYRQFVETAFLNPETKLWNGGFFATLAGDHQDGSLAVVSYLARDGEGLPPVYELQ
jgi:hypothetical protein